MSATIRTIWAIAKSPELALTDEELHLLVSAHTGKDSLRDLTPHEIHANIMPHNVTMMQLMVIIGALQQYAGRVALAQGADLETIKGNLLDVHFAAMDFLTEEAARRGRSVGNGGKR